MFYIGTSSSSSYVEGLFLLSCICKWDSDQKTNLNKIYVVREFPNVFSEDLPGLPLDIVGEFAIDLVIWTTSL